MTLQELEDRLTAMDDAELQDFIRKAPDPNSQLRRDSKRESIIAFYMGQLRTRPDFWEGKLGRVLNIPTEIERDREALRNGTVAEKRAVHVAETSNDIARAANNLARKANALALLAVIIAALALVAAVAAVIVSAYK